MVIKLKALSLFLPLTVIAALRPSFQAGDTASLKRSDHFERRQATGNTSYTPYIFDQPIDHFPDNDRYLPHDNATFQQRWWFDSSYYKPGGPIFFNVGGEGSDGNSDPFATLDSGIIQILMSQFNGLGVILEERYSGDSFPYNTTTTDQMAYLTVEQNIADLAYFAQHVVFPGIAANTSPQSAPWILYGATLAGAQTAFAMETYGDLFFGGIASSAVIHATATYPQWYAPVQKYAPQDCVASINGIVDKFDGLVASGNRDAVNVFKSLFGLQSLEDDRDFAVTIAFPIGNPLFYPTNTWQGRLSLDVCMTRGERFTKLFAAELNWDPTYGSDDFWNFCKNVTNLDAPPNVTNVDDVLASYTNGESWTNLGNYAAYIQQYILPLCPSGDYNNTSCFGTQNGKYKLPCSSSHSPQQYSAKVMHHTHTLTSTCPETYWADITNNFKRVFLYVACTEQGLYTAAPPQGPSLLSRTVQADYEQQWCDWAFQPGEFNAIPSGGPNLTYWQHYGDFNISADRLAFIDGDQDPFLDATYHSTEAPPRFQTDLHPELLIAGGGLHWDSYGIRNVEGEPQFIREAHEWETRTVQRWLETFGK
ncbi:MAG: hypothetical protein Q9162_001730 [Coniocarpon cinnabarinum]